MNEELTHLLQGLSILAAQAFARAAQGLEPDLHELWIVVKRLETEVSRRG